MAGQPNYDPQLMEMLLEHCDRSTDRVMREVVANLPTDAALANPATQAVLQMDAQVWNCYWAQIVAGFATLQIALPSITKPIPTFPPVAPPATTSSNTPSVPVLPFTPAALPAAPAAASQVPANLLQQLQALLPGLTAGH